jgi:hypothetical protein
MIHPWEDLRLRALLLMVLATMGCTRTGAHEASAEASNAWSMGLTEEQVLAVLKDEEACTEMYQRLMEAAGNPPTGSIEHLGVIRLKTHYDEYLREVQAGNLKTAARYFRRQIEGKNLMDLAWEQSAEAPPRGR